MPETRMKKWMWMLMSVYVCGGFSIFAIWFLDAQLEFLSSVDFSVWVVCLLPVVIIDFLVVVYFYINRAKLPQALDSLRLP